MTGVARYVDMSRSGRLFYCFAIFVTLAIISFPLCQLFTEPGYVFYRNGLDEGHYLVYEISKVASQQLVRPSQKLVTAMHEMDLSGGMINLVFDLITSILLLVILRSVFRRFTLFSPQAGLLVFTFSFLTLAFNAFNPLVDELRLLNLETKMMYWFTMPDDNHYVFARTPEPQFSYLLLAAAGLIALKARALWPVLLVLPFLYNFVLVPVAFAAGTKIMLRFLKNGFAAAALAYTAISLLLLAGYRILLSSDVAGLLVETHLPLLSFTGCIAVILHRSIRDRLPAMERELSFVMTVAIWQTANTQVICGILGAPSNYEQYFGVLVLSLQSCMAIALSANARTFLVPATAIFIIAMLKSFFFNYDLQQRLPPSRELLDELKRDAGSVALDNVHHTLSYNLVFARQSDTVLSYGRIYFWHADRNLKDYLCVREFIKNSPLHANFEQILRILDHGYEKKSEDNPVNHLFRKEVPVKNDIHTIPTDCGERKFKLFTEKAVE